MVALRFDRHAAAADAGWLGLRGRVCVITGAAGGIGEAIAAAFARAGASLALLDRDGEACRAVADRLRTAYAVEVEVLPADLADRAQLARALQVTPDFAAGTEREVIDAYLQSITQTS